VNIFYRIVSWFRRRKRALQKREYRFNGATWIHKPLTTEQASMASQLLYEAAENFQGEKMSVGQMLSRALDGATIARLMAILLLKENERFLESRVETRAKLFLDFPEEDALEVIQDFFTWNSRYTAVTLSSCGALIAARLGATGMDHTLTPDTANSP